MTATERPSLEARARDFWVAYWNGDAPTIQSLLEIVAAEERAFAETRLQTAVTTMEQATQAMLEAQAEVLELRAALDAVVRGIDEWNASVQGIIGRQVDYRWGDLEAARKALARPQPEAILRVLRAAVAFHQCGPLKIGERMDELDTAVAALPEGVREVLK